MARKKNSEKELRWRKLVDRQAGSGLSVRQFCANAGITEPSFYAWRKRFRGQDGAARRVPTPSGSEQVEGGSEFIPLRLSDALSRIVFKKTTPSAAIRRNLEYLVHIRRQDDASEPMRFGWYPANPGCDLYTRIVGMVRHEPPFHVTVAFWASYNFVCH